MEEVDQILLVSLRKLGCPLPTTVNAVSDFTSQSLFATLSHCLRLAKPLDLPVDLPSGMGERFRAAANVVAALQGLNFPGDIGYQVIMYPNAKDSRAMLSFALQHVPQGDGDQQDATGGGDAFGKRLEALAKAARSETWAPNAPAKAHTPFGSAPLFAPATGASYTEAESAYHREGLRPFSRQPHAQRAVAAILDYTSRLLGAEQLSRLATSDELRDAKAREHTHIADSIRSKLRQLPPPRRRGDDGRGATSRFQLQTQFADRKKADEPPPSDNEDELAELRKQLDEVNRRIGIAEADLDRLRKLFEASEVEKGSLTDELDDLEEEHRIDRIVMSLAGDIDGNLKKLRDASVELTNRLMEMNRQWDARRKPLVDEIRMRREELLTHRSSIDQLAQKREKLRSQMRDMIQKAREKEAQCQQLQSEVAGLPKETNRLHYTRKIMEIIKNVKKQKVDIDKILIDIHATRKEINSIEDTLSREFATVEELVYKDAKAPDPKQLNEASRKIYRLVVDLHKSFEQLTKQVEEAGSAQNACRDLEQRIEQLGGLTATLNTEQVLSDLAQIHEENQKLASER